MIRLGLAALLVAACGKPADPPSPQPAAGDAAVAPTKPTKKLGENCTFDGDCSSTMKCVQWMTEGAEVHHTCEIPCGPKPDHACPAGTGCVHQGGGPSGVCLKR